MVPSVPGRWIATVPRVPDDENFAVRVDCTVGGAAVATVRLQPPPVLPTSLALRVSPAEVSAAMPRAAIRATLLGPGGDPTPSAGVTLTAELGSIVEFETLPAGARGIYVGDAAVAAGGDALVAEWSRPLGEGAPAAIELGGERRPDMDHVRLAARVLDERGRPLAAERLTLRIGEHLVEVETDERGWATAALPAEGNVVVAEAAAASVVRRMALPGNARIGRTEQDADLQARVRLPIRSGSIRKVFLGTDPGTLVLTGTERARVIVRLEDKEGNPVADSSVTLKASEGVVTRPRRRPDGTYEALWAPPPGMRYGRVRITAESGDGAFATTSTDLDVVPREARRAPGLGVGWIGGSRGLASPFVRVSGDIRLPVAGEQVFGRAWVGTYGTTATSEDITGLAFAVDLDLVPVGLGLSTRQERGRLAGWAGASLVIAPYRIETRIQDSVAARGLGWAKPGFEFATGGAWRLRGGELTLDAGLLLLSVDSNGTGWRGPVGGAIGTVGYRLLF